MGGEECTILPCTIEWTIWETTIWFSTTLIASYLRTRDDWTFYRILKPFPIVLCLVFMLLGFVGVGQKGETVFSSPLYFWFSWLGLLFGGIGDILLITGSFAKFGVLSFALGHIFYLVAFIQKPYILPLWATILFSLLALGVPAALAFFASKKMEENGPLSRAGWGFILLACGYCVVIILMLMFAVNVNTYSWTKQDLSTGIALGAILFCLSDVLLVAFILLKVGASTLISSIPLMVYYFSQAFLAHGAVRLCFLYVSS